MRLSILSPVWVALLAFLVAVEASTPAQERAVSSKKPSLVGSGTGHSQSQIETTCSRFRQACIKAALSGKTSGKHAIVYDCYKKKPKNTQYTFGCRVGKKDYTSKALLNLSGGSTSTVYTAGSTTTKVTTETDFTSTTATYTSTEIDTDTETTTDSYSTTTTTTVGETTTQPETTVESYTTTETATVTVPTTVVVTDTVTSTSFSTSYTSVGDLFPVVDYQITTSSAGRRRSSRLDDSSFCTAYSSACSRQCTKVSSTPKHQVCHQKSAGRFSLSCICKNKKVETQHALADIGDDQHVTVVSTIATSSSTATVTSTIVVPTTVTTTQVTTTTSHVPVTSTIVSTVTSTGTVTATTTTSTTATVSATTLTTSPVTTTTATETATVIASTVVVVAPTGIVKATYSNGDADRYIARIDTTNRGLNTLVTDSASAEPVLIVYDATTGLYALQYVASGLYLSCEMGSTFSTGSYGFLVGAAGRAAGPAGGTGPWQGKKYESYCFSIAANSITSDNIPLQAAWIQPDGTYYTPYYNADYENPNTYIIVAGSATQFTSTYFPLVTLAVVPQP